MVNSLAYHPAAAKVTAASSGGAASWFTLEPLDTSLQRRVSRRGARALATVLLAPASDPEQQLRRAVTAALRLNLSRWPPVVYPSPAYGTPYLRDSFWTVQALGSRRFALNVLATFANAERADGDPPTMFVHAYRLPRYHDDESAALLLIWAWRNRTLYGITPPRPALQRALRYLLRRSQNGYLMTPAGTGGTWWDAYRFPTAGTLSYSQGLYAVALRCAQRLRLRLPPHAVVDAERAYRALYNPRLGYLPVGTQLPASDASALTGEFLSLWLFRRPILSNAAVLSTFHHLVPFGAGFEVVALPSGRFRGSPAMGSPGDYQNGASWLLYDALSIGAAGLHGLPDALSRLRARLALEFRHGVILHEYLQTDPSLPYYGTEPPFRNHFSWDTFVLVIDRVLRAHHIAHQGAHMLFGTACTGGLCPAQHALELSAGRTTKRSRAIGAPPLPAGARVRPPRRTWCS